MTVPSVVSPPHRSLVVLLALALMLIGTTTARAQESTPASSPGTDEARERNAAGEAFFAAGNFDSALVEFERVYDLLESNPNRYFVLYNIGQCHERLFRYDRAIEYYERYLAEGGPGAEDRATVEATIHTLEALLGIVVVTANVPAGEMWIDNQDIGPFDADHHEFHVPSGRHTIELRAEGFVPAQADVQVLARAQASTELTLRALSDYQGVEPWLFWTSAGVGAAALIAGAAFGITAVVQNSDANARCGNPMCTPTSVEAWRENNAALADSIRTNALVADVLYGTGALFAVTAFVLAFLTDWDGPAHADVATASLRFAPTGGPNGAGFSLTGSF